MKNKGYVDEIKLLLASIKNLNETIEEQEIRNARIKGRIQYALENIHSSTKLRETLTDIRSIMAGMK